ncbi:MAG: hypothetical protein ACLQVI_42195 [Polyangiaceae bacterium]|jgi:hypothetical protein
MKCSDTYGSSPTTRDDHPDVLDLAHRLPELRSHVDRPAPAGLVGRAADRHAAQMQELESPLVEDAGLVRRVEALEDDVEGEGGRGESIGAVLAIGGEPI